MPSRNGIRHTKPPDLVQSHHAELITPLLPLSVPSVAETWGQLVGRGLDTGSLSVTLVAPIPFLSPCCLMHAWLWRSTGRANFCTRVDCWMLSVRSYLAPILVRQANVEYVSTATEH